MKVATGTEKYRVDAQWVIARGASYSDTDLESALRGTAGEILRDVRGEEHLKHVLAKLATTEFQTETLQSVLSRKQPKPADWRVGEALAEAFLSDHRSCEFPWPQGRDLRNPSASPAGADLVGFQKDGKGPRFAFGEAKTSQDAKCPPGVMKGRCGLVKQLEKLRDDRDAAVQLVVYLAHRKQGATWQKSFDASARRYLADPSDVSLFGLLIRDVTPNSQDLKDRAAALATAKAGKTSLELRAIYLPSGSIASLANRVQKRTKAGGAK